MALTFRAVPTQLNAAISRIRFRLELPQEGGKYDHRHQLWQKHKNVDDTIQYPADHALSGRQCTDHTSQNQCQDAAGYADQQRLPGAVYQLRKNIISQRIGAKEMRRGMA